MILPLFFAAFAHESKLYLPLNLLCRQNHGARLDFLCTFSTNVFLQKCESVNFIYRLSSDLIFLFDQNRSSIFVQHKQKQARIFYTRKKNIFRSIFSALPENWLFFNIYSIYWFIALFIPFPPLYVFPDYTKETINEFPLRISAGYRAISLQKPDALHQRSAAYVAEGLPDPRIR